MAPALEAIVVPKRFAAITDEVLRREAGMLDDDVRILPQQMAILTGLSVDALKERRRTRPPKPPHPEPRERAGGAIWYSMGSVRQYRAWLNEHAVQDLGHAAEPANTNFGRWLSTGGREEHWPMALVGEFERPTDLWATVRGEIILNRKEPCLWLGLEDYAARLVTALSHERTKRSADQLSETLKSAASTRATPRRF